jgi:hypothetical protein
MSYLLVFSYHYDCPNIDSNWMVGHYLYNSRLHGHLVHDPQWPQLWGLALVMYGKMCLAGAVEIAYKQRFWVGFLSLDEEQSTKIQTGHCEETTFQNINY